MSDSNGIWSRQPYRSPDWRTVQTTLAGAGRLRAEALTRLLGSFMGHLRDHWLAPARQARQRRRDLAMLIDLDERTLDDIGLNRADLMAARYHRVPLERLVAKRHEYGASSVVPMSRPRPPAGPAHDLDAAA